MYQEVRKKGRTEGSWYDSTSFALNGDLQISNSLLGRDLDADCLPRDEFDKHVTEKGRLTCQDRVGQDVASTLIRANM